MLYNSKGLVAGLIIVGAGVLIWGISSQNTTDVNLAAAHVAVDSIEHESQNHIHGIGYDSQADRLFIATHFGLFMREDEQLYQVGSNRDDLMGFALNKRDPEVIYVSGHPRTGGNMGVRKSNDAGESFTTISPGTNRGLADFHALAVSYADPDRLYGMFMGTVHRSSDAGFTWEEVQSTGAPLQDGFCWHVPCTAADTADPDRLYAGTLAGLAVSHDQGETWEIIDNDAGVVVSVGVDPQNNQRLIAFTENHGLAISEDAGQTWQPRNNRLQLQEQELVLGFSFATNDSNHIYLMTNRDQVFKTENGGGDWQKVL